MALLCGSIAGRPAPGFDLWRRETSGAQRYTSQPSLPWPWFTETFHKFAERLAVRLSLTVSRDVRWPVFERAGWDLLKLVRAQSVLRAPFKRPLELWLVLDAALSLDEAYLDVSDSPHHHGSATLIARAIREAVISEVGITISAGVAPNKFLAKIASDWDKPDGLTTITPSQVADFVSALPVRRIHGVGPAMHKKLAAQGIERCEDILPWSKLELAQAFGSMGETLYRYARGEDHRPVANNRERKSLSVERTYADDMLTKRACLNQLVPLQGELQERLAKLTRRGAITGQFVKLKTHEFETTTVDRQLVGGLENAEFSDMLDEAWTRFKKPVRLLGVGLRFHTDHMSSDQQLRLFD